MLAPTATVFEASREVEVESGVTVTVAVPVELATFDAAFGVKRAVSCSGDVEAANEVWQTAVRVDGVIVLAAQPAIGAQPFVKMMVPAGEPAMEVTAANKVTSSFVTAAEGNATSDRLLPGFALGWPVPTPAARPNCRSR